MDIRRIAYAKYKVDWMLSHGFSEKDISDIAIDWLNERMAYPDMDQSFYDFIEERGFGAGSLWVCFEEFLGAEYEDSSYMRSILSETEWEEWKKNHTNNKEKENELFHHISNKNHQTV